jgi:hypothetical protein
VQNSDPLYQPQPLDTTSVALGPELASLSDLLSRNTHEIWAKGRIAEGWRYGPLRDDGRREHPGLVPYDELSDTEKAYDRWTSLGAIEAILALGYRILPPGAEPDMAPIADAVADSERLLAAGEPLMAYDALTCVQQAEQGLTERRATRVLALALARSGATERAQALLQPLAADGTDIEAQGILARTWRDRWEREPDTPEGREHLRLAHALYLAGHREACLRQDDDGAIYTGINAASTLLLLGDMPAAATLALEVQALCKRRLAKGTDYWAQAGLAESLLVIGDVTGAAIQYQAAAGLAGNRYGDLATTRRQARRLLAARGMDPGVIDGALPVPAVVVFAGNMVDQPGRAKPRFPAERTGAVKAAIAQRLDSAGARFGYSSGACGSDILFMEAMLERGGEVTVVLPFSREEFRRGSVDILPGADWGSRFDRLLDARDRVTVLFAGEHRVSGGGAAYEFANQLQFGMAKLRAERLGADLVPLAVWDGRPGDGPSGTEAQVKVWQAAGLSVDIVDLGAITRATGLLRPGSEGHPVPAPETADPPDFQQHVMAMLFADAVGYSQLNEEQIPTFVREFLGSVSELLDRSPHKPVMKNTWGDAVFFVFDEIEAAGALALDLRDRIRGTDWVAHGLPARMNLRIALHAGPVYGFSDPVTHHPNFSGTHVSMAARIEPITPPGEVYCSEPFAVLAATRGVTAFACDYVGRTPLAKKYGVFPTYHLRRT